MTRWLETDSLSNQDISSALAIGAYTADADRLILVQFMADQIAGNGDYVFYVTLRINGAGSSYQLVPTTTATVASGVTAIGGQSAMIAVRSGDVVTVYLDGLAGDNANPDTTVRWFELAALQPATADRRATIDANGRIAADAQAISGDTTAADNLETMLDGTGGATLSLAALNVVANASTPAVTISNAGAGEAVKLQSEAGHTVYIKQAAPSYVAAGIYVESASYGIYVNATRDALRLLAYSGIGLYVVTDRGVASVYLEGPTSGYGSALALSTPGGMPPQDPAWGQLIKFELYGGKPAIRVTNTDGAGNVMEVLDSDNGNWVLDDKLFALPADTANAVRTELAVELAHLDEDVSAGAHAGDAMALADDAITAAKFDQSTAHPLAQADAGSTAVARTGADGDTLKALSDEIAGIEAGSGLTAQETANAVHNLAPAGTPAAGSIGDKLNDLPATILTTAVAAYAGTPGTFGYLLSLLAGLDFTQVNLVAASNAGEITIKRTLTLAAVVSGLTIPADWTACYWTVKRSTDDADADALVQTLASNPPDADDGLRVLMGAAVEDQTAGSLTVNQAGGTVTIALDDASTAALEDAVELVWDVKVHATSGKTQPGAGTATITTAVTRA